MKDRGIALDTFPPHTREAADALADAVARHLAVLRELRRRTKGIPSPTERDVIEALTGYLGTG